MAARARPDIVRSLAPAVLLLLALATTLVAARMLRDAIAARRAAVVASMPSRKVPLPLAPLPGMPAPPVEPTILADLTPDQARASNAAVPIIAGRIAPARPFVYAGTVFDRAAARTCLAAAVLYEAGDDRVGEAAVAQVVLNRLRHPAFPKTVCGVVFQGSERGTGCQFTFTCDGALDRVPAAAAWKRAEDVADAALSGFVVKAVGTATHYHADYVVPYWRDTLDKVAVIGAHIFYRWQGGWGLPAAFTGRPQPLEQIDPRLVALAGPGQLAMPVDTAGLIVDADAAAPQPAPVPRTRIDVPGITAAELNGSIVRLMDAEAGQFVVQLEPSAAPDTYAMLAERLCHPHADCLVFGWTDIQQMPRSLPLMPMGMRGMGFLYRKSSLSGEAHPFWNCRRTHRRDPVQCIPGTD